MTAMSDLGKVLITLGLDARVMLLKIYMLLMTLSTISDVIETLVFSMKYRIPKILR